MPRLDSEEGTSSGATSRSSSATGVLAKPSNETPSKTILDEGNHVPQGAMDKGTPLSTRQGHVSSPSDRATSADPSWSASPGSRPVPPSADGPAPAPENLASEIANLIKHLQAVSSLAAGKALQTCWRKFLFSDNDQDHLCWVLRAGIKNAPTPVIERILKDQTILNVLAPVASKKEAIVKAVLADTTYDQLLQCIPEYILDQEIQQRLKTMPAKPLIRWLAEAERLGFREDDIINDEDESVIPNPATSGSNMPVSAILHPTTPTPTAAISVAGYMHIDDESESASGDVVMLDGPPSKHYPPHRGRDPIQQYNARQAQHAMGPPPGNSNNVPLICPVCHFIFATVSGYNYHLTKKVCGKTPPPKGYKWRCENCAQGFITKQGMNYHVNLGKVCSADDIAPATTPSGETQQPPENQGAAIPLPSQYNPRRPILPPPRPTISASQQLQAQNWFPERAGISQYDEQAHPHPHPGAAIPQPPLQTPASDESRQSKSHIVTLAGGQPTPGQPTSSQLTPSTQPRMSPSELSPLKLSQLNKALADQEARYQGLCAEVDPKLGPQERAAKLQSLKNAHATRKSLIRKSFNVTLRTGRDKQTTAGKDSVPTPPARPSFEEYRANHNIIGTAYAETIPVRSSPLSAPPSSFLPMNAGQNNEFTSYHPTGSPPQVHKRQRTDAADSPAYANRNLPNQASVQSGSARAGDGTISQVPGPTKTRHNESGCSESEREPTDSPNTLLAGPEPVEDPKLTKQPQYIDIPSTSEDSTEGEDVVAIPQRDSPLAMHGRATSDTRQDARNGTERRSFEKRGSEGGVRGAFTAKRGRR